MILGARLTCRVTFYDKSSSSLQLANVGSSAPRLFPQALLEGADLCQEVLILIVNSFPSLLTLA